MPVAIAEKVRAICQDFGSQRKLAQLLDVSPAQVTRWIKGNGIDGTVSSAAGAALATGRPVVLLIGELALLHDIGGLLAARRAGGELTIVCANNGGGGIFDFLPVAGAADPALYEEHIVTPSGVDLQKLAALTEMPLTEVRTDRAENVAQHRALFARVAEQLA